MNAWLLPIKKQLTLQIQQNKLAHALIIKGSKEVGAAELSLWLSRTLLCENRLLDSKNEILTYCGQCKSCHLLEGDTHPDAIVITLEGESHGVDAIRRISRLLEKTAQFGGAQVVSIQDAERMTIAAANALLKTLEEPTANSFLSLVTNDIDKLLPTMISRAQIIDIRPNSIDVLADVKDKTLVNDFSHPSHLGFLVNEDIRECFKKFYQLFLAFICGSNNRVELLSVMNESNFDLRWSEQIITDLMRQEAQWLQDNLRAGVLDTSEANQIPSHVIWSIHTILLEKLRVLNDQPQANKQMIHEAFLVEIKESTKTEAI